MNDNRNWDVPLGADANIAPEMLRGVIKLEAMEGSELLEAARHFLEHGQPGKALECFQRRASMGGPKEEIWYSRYAMARVQHTEGLLDRPSVIQAYAEVFDFLPSRLEPVAHLAKLYREAGDFQTAYELSRLILETPRPDGALYLEPEIYDVILPLEFVQACHAVSRPGESKEMVRWLLSNPELPAEIRTLLLEGESTGASDLGATALASNPLAFVVPGWWEHE